ncbi:MAG: endonuclease/exonuclease/phosphatase family protein [Pseudomonadota bacterium]
MRVVLLSVAGLAAGLVGLGYAGALHPVGDSFAVVRFLALGVLAVALLGLLRNRLAQVLFVICVGLFGIRVWHAVPGPSVAAPDMVIYQKNMLYHDYDEVALAQDIWASGSRVVTLQEVSAAHRDFLHLMEDTHPYQLICDGTAVGAVAVLSTDPSVARTCSDPVGIAVMDVAINDGQDLMRVVSVHLHWPWPFEQSSTLDLILADLEAADLDAFGAPDHVVVGGDFNMVPWGHSLRRVEAFFGTSRLGHIEQTFDIFGWPMTIDHVMASAPVEASINVRPLLGSDHHGVVGRVVFD